MSSGCRSLARVPAFLGEQLRRVATVQAGNFGGMRRTFSRASWHRMPACQPQVLPGVQTATAARRGAIEPFRPFVIGDMPFGHLPARRRGASSTPRGRQDAGVYKRGMFFGVAFFDSRTLADMPRAGFLSIGGRAARSQDRYSRGRTCLCHPCMVGKMWRYRRRTTHVRPAMPTATYPAARRRQRPRRALALSGCAPSGMPFSGLPSRSPGGPGSTWCRRPPTAPTRCGWALRSTASLNVLPAEGRGRRNGAVHAETVFGEVSAVGGDEPARARVLRTLSAIVAIECMTKVITQAAGEGQPHR